MTRGGGKELWGRWGQPSCKRCHGVISCQLMTTHNNPNPTPSEASREASRAYRLARVICKERGLDPDKCTVGEWKAALDAARVELARVGRPDNYVARAEQMSAMAHPVAVEWNVDATHAVNECSACHEAMQSAIITARATGSVGSTYSYGVHVARVSRKAVAQ